MYAWYIEVLRKYTVFDGRAGRPEFWWFSLCNLIVTLLIDLAGIVLFGIRGVFLGDVYGLAVLLPNLGVSIRRLHDTNRSGWWILIGLVPFVGWIFLLVFFILKGDAMQNSYGPLPPSAPRAAWRA